MSQDDDFDDGLPEVGPEPGAGRLRLDKWLWFARFFKTRSLAAKICNGGVVRCSGAIVTKAHYAVKPGDVLTFPQGRHIRVIKVLGLGTRRGPAEEARGLYEDLSPPAPETAMDLPGRPLGLGRPTKRDRRALEKLKAEE